MSTRPSLATFAALYSAAVDQAAVGHCAMQRVAESAARHGYTREEVVNAARKAHEAAQLPVDSRFTLTARTS